jgi:hypothetical protein
MDSLEARINALSNPKVVGFFEHFAEEVLSLPGASLERVVGGIPEPIRAIDGLARIERLTPDEAEQLLNLKTSAALARGILVELARDETFAPLIDTALASYRDDRMMADVVLALGLAASMVLIAATTELEGEVFGIKFKKGAASPEIVKNLAEIVKNLVGLFSPVAPGGRG